MLQRIWLPTSETQITYQTGTVLNRISIAIHTRARHTEHDVSKRAQERGPVHEINQAGRGQDFDLSHVSDIQHRCTVTTGLARNLARATNSSTKEHPRNALYHFGKSGKQVRHPRNERALARNCCEMTKRTDKRTAKDAAIEKAEERGDEDGGNTGRGTKTCQGEIPHDQSRSAMYH